MKKLKSKKQALEEIEKLMVKSMEILGLDLKHDSTRDTPKRVTKMWVNEIFSSLREKPPKMTVFDAPSDSMVTEIGITVRSMCEHHFMPIYGRCHIAYIPDKKVLGLSKLNRAVDYFCRMPQIQERLTDDIAKFLKGHLKTEDVAVVIDSDHFCVKMRGIKDDNSLTRTTILGGRFKDNPEVRQEFFAAIPRMKHG